MSSVESSTISSEATTLIRIGELWAIEVINAELLLGIVHSKIPLDAPVLVAWHGLERVQSLDGFSVDLRIDELVGRVRERDLDW